MKCLVLCILGLAATIGFAGAGPNEGIVLAIHGNTAGVETEGDPCSSVILPCNFQDLIPSAMPDDSGVEWFLLVVVSPQVNDANFSTVVFGLGDYDPAMNDIAFASPCHSDIQYIEITTDGWPGPLSGTAISWSPDCLTDYLEPIYYLGVYSYGPGTIPLSIHPVQPSGVVSCGMDPEMDVIEDFGIIGCGGEAGWNPDCPDLPTELEACCLGQDCILLTQTACERREGLWVGGPCLPKSCKWAVSILDSKRGLQRTTTWGSIKSVYR